MGELAGIHCRASGQPAEEEFHAGFNEKFQRLRPRPEAAWGVLLFLHHPPGPSVGPRLIINRTPITHVQRCLEHPALATCSDQAERCDPIGKERFNPLLIRSQIAQIVPGPDHRAHAPGEHRPGCEDRTRTRRASGICAILHK